MDEALTEETSVRKLLGALQENAAGGFAAARSLPPAIYHDARIFALEKQHIFGAGWICLGRAADIPRVGDYLCRTSADAPVFIVRNRDASIRAFANVCAHRAAQLLDGAGHVSRISCPYHSWTYDLDGQLVGAPFMQKTPGFDLAKFRLRELACEAWQGFVYVSLNGNAPSVKDRLQGLADIVGDYRMADYVPVFSQEETWQTSWKCLVENFMDAYHIHRVHRNSFARDGSSEDRTELFAGEEAYSYHFVQEDETSHADYAHPDNTWLQGADRFRTWLVNIFPSHVIQLQPDMLWYLSILPDGVDKVNIRWSVSIPAEILDAARDREGKICAVLEFLQQVNAEDRPIVESVFRSTAAPGAAPGPLSYLERNVWEFGRYLARSLGPGALGNGGNENSP